MSHAPGCRVGPAPLRVAELSLQVAQSVAGHCAVQVAGCLGTVATSRREWTGRLLSPKRSESDTVSGTTSWPYPARGGRTWKGQQQFSEAESGLKRDAPTILKPFTAERLTEKVQEVLAAKPPSPFDRPSDPWRNV